MTPGQLATLAGFGNVGFVFQHLNLLPVLHGRTRTSELPLSVTGPLQEGAGDERVKAGRLGVVGLEDRLRALPPSALRWSGNQRVGRLPAPIVADPTGRAARRRPYRAARSRPRSSQDVLDFAGPA